MFQFVYLAEKMLKAMFALDCGSVRVIWNVKKSSTPLVIVRSKAVIDTQITILFACTFRAFSNDVEIPV